MKESKAIENVKYLIDVLKFRNISKVDITSDDFVLNESDVYRVLNIAINETKKEELEEVISLLKQLKIQNTNNNEFDKQRAFAFNDAIVIFENKQKHFGERIE